MAKIIGREKTDNGASYRIDFENGITLWFDVWMSDGEITGDWNKYIFHTENAKDVEEKAFQEAHSDEAGAYNFMTAMELASAAFEEEK